MSQVTRQFNQRVNPAHEVRAIVLATGVTVGALVVIAIGWWVMWSAMLWVTPDPVRDAKLAADEAREVEARRIAKLGPMKPALDLQSVARGKRLYASACITCHAADAHGVPKMGKDLVDGYFANHTNDPSLINFIKTGRDIADPSNTTKMPMPARGGRVDYTDQDITDIVAFVRSLQDPRRITAPVPDVKVATLDAEPEPVIARADPVTQVAGGAGDMPLVIPASTGLDPDAIGRGKRVFASCMACHGKSGTGIPRTGANLIDSVFIKNKSDAELLAFIKKGRQPGEPESRLQLAMPAKGGNPSLTDEKLKDVIVYIRSLQQAATDAK